MTVACPHCGSREGWVPWSRRLNDQWETWEHWEPWHEASPAITCVDERVIDTCRACGEIVT